MPYLGLVVDLSLAKKTKTACENTKIFNRRYGAQKSTNNGDSNCIIIGTTLIISANEGYDVDLFLTKLTEESSASISVRSYFTEDILAHLKFTILEEHTADNTIATKSTQLSPFERALVAITLPPDVRSKYLSSIPRFESYSDFTLLQNTILEPPWSDLLSSQQSTEFLSHLALYLKTSHLAAKVAIPRDDPVRRPIIKPLFGDFGNFNAVQSPPLQRDFDTVFWTMATLLLDRGSIKYTWSPMFTMYSKGNTSEKRRIASLPNMADATVVDLYAGIGYFVFAYLHAGAKKVFACEVNPWSIEGLRRGAETNGFSYEAKQQSQLSLDEGESTSQITMFPFSNTLAAPYLKTVAAQHVNLGLLPDARLGISIAVDALSDKGGWLHIHEEVALCGDKRSRQRPKQEWAELIENVVEVDCKKRWSTDKHSISVTTQWVEEVKTLGKNLWHLVADVEVVVA